MRLTGFYTVVCTDRLVESRDFSTRLFGFEVAFEADRYISLRHPGPHPFELALLDPAHPTIPETRDTATRGI